MTCPAHQLAASRQMLVEEDVDLVRELVALLPKDEKVKVVSLGTGSGTVDLAVFAERKHNIHLDSYDNDTRWGEEVVKNIGQSDNYTAFQRDLLKPAEDTEEVIDLLLLDAQPKRTAEILKVWLPLLKRGSLVWIHDYERDAKKHGISGAKKSDAGVKEAIEELVETGALEGWGERGLGWVGRWHGERSKVDQSSLDETHPDPLPEGFSLTKEEDKPKATSSVKKVGRPKATKKAEKGS